MEIERPKGLTDRQHNHWDRAVRLLDRLHHRQVLVSAVLETVVGDKNWINLVDVKEGNRLEHTGPDLNEDEETRERVWRMELVLKPPFSIALTMEMALDFRDVDLFMPELLLRDANCRTVNAAEELDMVFVLEAPV